MRWRTHATAPCPPDELFSPAEIAAWAGAAVGPSFGAYRYGGHQWALPLDAAAQICMVHPCLMDARPPPTTWQEVAVVARELPVALVLGGPHALLTLLAICAAQGVPPVAETGGGSPAGDFAEDRAARDAVLGALDLLADICA